MQIATHIVSVVERFIGKPGSLRFRLARDTVGVMLIQVLSMVLGFTVSIVLARLLGVREFGLYSLAMSVLGLLVVPATFGFPQLLVREIAAYRVKGEWGLIHGLLSFALRASLLASFLLAVLGSFALWFLSDHFSKETFSVLALAFVSLPLWALLHLHGEALRGFQRILEGQWITTVMRPLCFLLLIGGTWFFTGKLLNASIVLILNIFATGITLIFAFFLLRKQVNNYVCSDNIIQKTSVWLRSALFLALLSLLNLIPQHAGILMLAWICGAEEVGLYKVAFQAASLIPFGLTAVYTAIGPTLAQLYAAGDKRGLQKIMLMACVVGTIFALPFVFLFIIQGSWFLDKAFGKEFIPSATALAIITVGQFIHAVTGPVGLLLVMSGYENKATLSIAIGSGVNLLLNSVLIPLWNFNGAAIATTLTLAVTKFLYLYFVIQCVQITPFSLGGRE